MKYEIIFPAIPDATYRVDLSIMDTRTPDEYAYDLARRMHQSEWFIRQEHSPLWLHVICTQPPTVQYVWTTTAPTR